MVRVIAVCCLIPSVLFFWAIWANMSLVYESKTWPKTLVTKVDKHFTNDDTGTSCTINYFYIVNDKEYNNLVSEVVHSTGLHCSDINSLHQQVMNKNLFCYYKPENPKISFINRTLAKWRMQFAAFFASLFLCLFIYLVSISDNGLHAYLHVIFVVMLGEYNIQLQSNFDTSVLICSLLPMFLLAFMYFDKPEVRRMRSFPSDESIPYQLI